MIDIHEVKNKTITYCCYECEKKFNAPVRFSWKVGHSRGTLKKFFDAHEKCDVHCPNVWTDLAVTEFEHRVKIMESIYKDNPDLTYSDAIKLYAAREKDIEELTR